MTFRPLLSVVPGLRSADEAPRPGSRIHGLQVFVNLPQRQRYDAPTSLLVRGSDMPVLYSDNYRVRVALGRSNGVRGFDAPGSPMTLLDGHVMGPRGFEHRLETHRNAWIHAIDGELAVSVAGVLRTIAPGHAVCIGNPADGGAAHVRLWSVGGTPSHFALFDAEPLGESFVQHGPFVMGSAEEIAAAQDAYEAGRFGRID